ncbi:MAG: type II secretion system protein GspN [Desulfobacterales bacterium]|jgi:type II secretion system protein N
MKIFKTRVSWAIYIICAALFFLYALFPSEMVKEYLAGQVHQTHPDLTIKMGRVRPVIPPGLKLYDVSVYHLGQRIAELEDLNITPDILSLLSATTHLNFRGDGYGGILKGGIDITGNSPQRDVVVGADLTGIQVSQIEALTFLTAHKISGNLNATLTYRTNMPAEPLTGDLTLTKGQIEFSAPIMKQDSINFDTIEAELIFNGSSLTIKHCRIDGDLLDADVSGSIKFTGRSAARKILDLSGTVKPHETLFAKLGRNISELIEHRNLENQGIAFKIKGPLDSPNYSFY